LTISRRGQPKLDKEIFLDRTHGGRIIGILRQAGFVVHPIQEVYPERHQFISDPEWLQKCAENDWVIVTGDKRIESAPENRQAVIETRARVFILGDSNSVPEEWAAAIIVGHHRMQEILDANLGPFFVSVRKRADSIIERLRYPRGYQPFAEVPPPPSATPTEQPESVPDTEKKDVSKMRKSGDLFK
jgi:hypothetical protein